MADLASRQSVRLIRTAGIVVGVALGAVLATVLIHDHTRRTESARSQGHALASGAQHLLIAQLHGLQRAMQGVAVDTQDIQRAAPGQSSELVARKLAGVVARRSGLSDLMLVDPDGHALTQGTPDPHLREWATTRPSDPTPMALGPLGKGPDGRWAMPVALPLASGGWVFARLDQSQFQEVVDHVDAGPHGATAIIDRFTLIVARAGSAADVIGQPASVLFEPHREGGDIGLSKLDDTERLVASNEPVTYPLGVGVGIAVRDYMGPWYNFLGVSVAVWVLYWLGFVFLYRRVTSADTAQRHHVAELTETTERWRQAQKLGHTGTWRADARRNRVVWDTQVEAMLGVAASEGIDDATFFRHIHPEDVERTKADFIYAWKSGETLNLDFRWLRPDGTQRWISTTGAIIEPDGEKAMTGTAVDATDRIETQRQLAEAEQRFRLMFERTPLPAWVFDTESLDFLEVNAAAVRNYGYSHAEFLRMAVIDIRPESEIAPLQQALATHDTATMMGRTWVHRRKDGSLIDVRIHTTVLEFNGHHARLVLAEDVTERTRAERDLAWRATHDMLTGLANTEALSDFLDRRFGTRRWYEVIYVHLRGLDLIADTYGLEAGRTVLQQVGRRFATLGTDFGMAAHRPSERFLLAVMHPDKRERAAAALTAAVSEPVLLDGTWHALDPEIGIATHPADGGSAEQIIAAAAMAAHFHGENQGLMRPFEPSMAERSIERLRMASRIRQGIEQNEFMLHFQPILDASTGQVEKLEALLRWPAADGTFVPPEEFIPLSEQTGLIVEIGRWVLDEAARCHVALARAGHGHLSIAVNVSAVQFQRTDVAADVHAVIERFALPRGALAIELTESSLMANRRSAMSAMRRLSAQGTHVSLDDFGTGFSSMAYLRDLPIDALKIDRVFVSDVYANERSASICRAIITLAHTLGMGVVAEGVENPAQQAWLMAAGCDFVQGFQLARPMAFDALLAYLHPAEPASTPVRPA
ncbi:EAL domain-containing protein [Luteibacter pinisoli]|uniref:EAL domain-containing protein n=1 Tax=Luteibacter pinisoli TaxID=2589080 RepID=A0A4Y5YZA7_9GAMM|nr:EAL domain-containing protein [Luteibacter pinisoli]QDE38261.1 EAL domain-containing protein [Luteibacter pinisoli]